ncbi:MAG: DUF4388 domain-containing protein [Planctomycetota bacterium]|nr:DUF4388 domain-containing protein [Planctomycetota bacterium]
MHGGSFKGHVGGVKNLADIFRSLANDRQSGTLTITEKRLTKKIYFEQGSITLLSSTRRLRIGELLVATGKITDDDLELAIKLQKQSRNRLGEILVEEGFCDEEDIKRIVRYQVEGEIYDCFLWQEAEYEFQPGVKPDELQGGNPQILRLDINTNALVMEALHRLEEWRTTIRPLVPTTKEVYMQTGRNAEGMGLPEKLIEVFPDINGQYSVLQLAEMAQLSDFEICKHFATLVKMGILRPLSVEELFKSSGEAYALNDFAKAVTLYSRLEEIYPQDLKILVPLADSLRQLGQTVEAMPVYETAQAIMQAEGDEESLKRCWTTMLSMDPNRQDVFQALQAIEAKNLAAQQQRRRVIPWIVIGVIIISLVGVNVFLYKESQRKKLEDQENSEKLETRLIEYKQLLKNENWSGAHAAGLSLIKEFSKYEKTKAVTLPVTIETEPPGFAVFLNDKFIGETSLITSMVIGQYIPSAGPVKISLKHGGKDGQSVVYTLKSSENKDAIERGFDPSEFNSLNLLVSGKNRWSQLAEARFNGEISYLPGRKRYVISSREGRVYTMDSSGELSKSKVTVGEYGDILSGITVFENQVYIGLTLGGVKRIDVSETPLPDEESYPADAPVHGAPIVTKTHVVFASFDGYIYIYKRGGKLVKKIECAGYLPHKGALLEEKNVALFAGDDGYLRSIDIEKAKEVFRVDLGRRPVKSPIVCGDNVAVLLQGGVAAITSSSQVSKPVFIRSRGQAPFDLSGDENAIFMASHGQLDAYDVRTQKPLWKKSFRSQPKNFSHVALVKDRVLFSSGESVVYGLDRFEGRLVWRGDLGKSSWISSPFSVFNDHALVVLRGRAVGKLVPYYDK